MDVNTTIERTARIIKTKAPKAKVYLFGSRSRGDNTKYSDIDIAIEESKKINSKTFIEIQEEIENMNTFYPVQIVDMKNTSEIFYNKVMAYAKEIHI